MNLRRLFMEQIEINTAIPAIKKFLLDLQNRICQFLEVADGQAIFITDEWKYVENGGGITKVLTSEAVIEKAGVNFSHVKGQQLPAAASASRSELAKSPFEALGVSVVVHPRNPFVPTCHFNVRFIVIQKEDGVHWWFGGGFDLTPYYGFVDDCIHWHTQAKAACEPFGKEVYPHYKKWCDDYFFLKHRNEPRGIGGLFFDDLNEWGFARCFSFMQSVGNHFITAYQPILNRRKQHAFTQQERNFQLYRRGRYVEFNLLYDRGTLFGLQSGGRTESILMSLPPLVAWHYNGQSPQNMDEARLYEDFLRPREWLV